MKARNPDKRTWSLADKEAHFEQYRDALVREARNLTGFITIHRQINDAKNDRLNELNVAPAFFMTVQQSLFSNIIIWSHKMFGGEEARCIPNFLNDMNAMQEIFTLECKKARRPELKDGDYGLSIHENITREHIKEDKKLISELREDILNSIELHRHKYHAHFDGDYFLKPDKLFDDGPLTLNGFDRVDKVVFDVFNRYSAAYDGTVHRFKSMNLEDLRDILDDLHYNGRNARQH